MKIIYKQISVWCILLVLILAGCKKDKVAGVSTTLTAPALLGPADQTVLNLNPVLNGVVTFEWAAAKTGNFTTSFYEVQFDKETGDFSKPVYKAVPARGGVETKLVLSHKEVNKIASAAGIGELAGGKVKWRVVANTGIQTAGSGVGVLELHRPAGFAENPADLFITGMATEKGEDISKALKFKKLSDGVFEIYTSLLPGTFKMVNQVSAGNLSFIPEGNLIKEGTAANSPSTAKTVYRINVDFNASTIRFTEITTVGIWFSPQNRIAHILPYVGNGVWKTTDVPIVFKQESWGRDDRYKFRMIEKDENGTAVTKSWGAAAKDNNPPSGSSPASYFYLQEVDNSQYDFIYKFVKEASKADIEVSLSPAGPYTHAITYK